MGFVHGASPRWKCNGIVLFSIVQFIIGIFQLEDNVKEPESILLVDDDNVSTYLIQRLISKYYKNSEVIVARNGEDALNIIQDMCLTGSIECPHLIILDINMPVMDGLEFMKVLTDSGLKKHFRIVVFTTSSNERDFTILRSYGINEFYLKPVTEGEMLEIVQKQSSFQPSR